MLTWAGRPVLKLINRNGPGPTVRLGSPTSVTVSRVRPRTLSRVRFVAILSSAAGLPAFASNAQSLPVRSTCSGVFGRHIATVLVLAAIAGLMVVLIGGPASAAQQPGDGTLTLTPATGSDLTIPTITTSGPCPSAADSYIVLVNGPGGFSNFPIVGNTTVGISHDGPFSVQFGLTMRDAAGLQGVVPGRYDVTLRCIDGFTLEVFRSFTTAMVFISPTQYTTTDPNASPTPPPTPTPVPVVAPTLTLTADPSSPQIEGTTVSLGVSINWPYPFAGELVADNTVIWTGKKNQHGPGGLSATVGWTPSVGQHRVVARAYPTYCPISSGVTCRSTSAELIYVVNPAPTPTPSPTPLPGITPTTTTLLVTPTPAFTFFPAILIARVSPFNVAGTVQFMDGNTPLGAPVPMTAGLVFAIRSLPQGAHSLTAVFTPTDTAAYVPSSSAAVPLTVNPLVRLR